MELSAPFLAANWPYLVSLLTGILVAQFIARVFQKQPTCSSSTGDVVDPFEDSDVASIPGSDPLKLKSSGSEDVENIPYPWFGERLSEEEMKRTSLEFYEQMNKRRTVRLISDEDIPLDVVENLVRTAGECIPPF